VARLPKVAAPDRTAPATYQIPDTIEGWADAFGVLLSSYFMDDQPFPEYAGRHVIFDATLVRPKGAPISSGSRAPGPGPLLRALENARALLDRVTGVLMDGPFTTWSSLAPINAFDLVMYAADAVLSGGVRRSATIAVFSPDDQDMVNAKATPRWWELEPQRQRANISAVLLRGSTDFETFAGLVERTKKWGEPGFIWTDDLELVVNPCVEIGMWPCLEVDSVDYDRLFPGTRSGVEFRNGTVRLPGWQMCNLATVNGAKCDTPEAFFGAARAATTLSTLQAGYTTFEYLGWVTEEIVRKEALLGVSMTGMMDQPDVLFDPAVLEAGAAIVKEVNARVAAAIGINPAARTTCVKPEGKSSLILETLAAGIHPWPSKRGIRHVRASILEAPFQHFKQANPHAVFDLAITDPNHDNTVVLAFTYEAPPGALTQEDVDAMALLERVVLVRRHWIEPGTRPERCVRRWLRHNVSNTIHVRDDHEWDTVTRFIFDHREDFAGVAMLPSVGDKLYHLAPNTHARTPEEQVAMYGIHAVHRARLLVDTLPSSMGGLWPACSLIVDGNGGQHTTEEWTWIHAFEALAVDHFDGNLRRAEIAVKDVDVWERFVYLRDHLTPVDWTTMSEADDSVEWVGGDSGACDGAKCEIDFSMFTPAGK
jgi:ribonucleoside-diphosphate reductase alpha chain